MKTRHEKLLEAALRYVSRVHADTWVPPERVLESLEEIRDAVEERIMAIQEDISRKKSDEIS